MEKTFLTTKEIAEYCQVTQRTAVQWINEDKLKFFRTLGKHIRVNRSDFLDFLREHQMPIPAELTISSHTTGKKKILIVDDDRGMVDSILRFLKREKQFDLDVAFDGFEAGQKFITFKPDVVILDVRMPYVDGYKLCSAIRNNPDNKNVKVIFISALLDIKDTDMIKEIGADAYLTKPFEHKELKTKIYGLFGWNKRAQDTQPEIARIDK